MHWSFVHWVEFDDLARGDCCANIVYHLAVLHACSTQLLFEAIPVVFVFFSIHELFAHQLDHHILKVDLAPPKSMGSDKLPPAMILLSCLQKDIKPSYLLRRLRTEVGFGTEARTNVQLITELWPRRGSRGDRALGMISGSPIQDS